MAREQKFMHINNYVRLSIQSVKIHTNIQVIFKTNLQKFKTVD